VTGVPGDGNDLPDLNNMARPRTPTDDPNRPTTRPLFRRPKSWGRMDLVKKGNDVEITSWHVTEFTLLLSPDAFDFSKPVKVTANGKKIFDGRVEKNLATLMKWAARDNDRTMLFGAELHLKAQ
jgi:hypothetical protein